MDQLKELIRQAIRYRFWIAVGVSALLPMIAYLVGSGPIRVKADSEAALIVSAQKDVKQYSEGTVPNQQYQPLVAGKTAELTEDVNKSWKKLYDRQAPLLTWPELVHDRFTAWGRKWPENVDASAVQNAIIEYVNAYPAYVTKVYESFKPFDPVEGTGIVSSPPEDVLLRPAKFPIETPPSLGKVWSAQERLWIQRTMLEVVAQVNGNAKDWDGAIIKQINALEVGNSAAQDQRSIAKGDTLEEAAEITDPSKPAEAVEAAPDDSSGMMGMMGMMGGSGGATDTETVSYIKTESTQFKVLPVQLSVLIEQDHIQDLLVALENSPMNVQVMDFEMSKPGARVVKPEKGAAMNFGMMGGAGGMGGGYSAMMMGSQMTGFGGRSAGGGAGYESMMSGTMGMGPGGMMGMTGSAEARKGVDARSKDRTKAAADALKNMTKKSAPSTLHDPYFNIVEVKIYGQARFFNPPPTEAPAEPSQSAEGDAAKKADDTKSEGEAGEKKAGDGTKAEGEPKAKNDDEAKAEGEPKAKKDETKAEGESKETKAEGDSAKKGEGGEKKKADDAKAVSEPKAKKDDAPKGEGGSKAESTKADVPK